MQNLYAKKHKRNNDNEKDVDQQLLEQEAKLMKRETLRQEIFH
jgi:hypothetical protein